MSLHFFFLIFCFSVFYFPLFMPGSGRKNANNSSCVIFFQNYRTGYHRGCVAESVDYHLVQITDSALPGSASGESHSII